MTYAEIDPFGSERGDLQAGIVASTLANVNRGKNKKAYRARDFMPEFKRKKAQTASDIINFFKALEQGTNDNNR